MRWILVPLTVLLLVWLASGDAKAQPWGPAWSPPAQPAPHVEFGSIGPATFGAWVDLGTVCRVGGGDHVVTIHYSYGLADAADHSIVAHIGCPFVPVYVGEVVDLSAGVTVTLTRVYAEMGDHAGLRIPAQGYATDAVIEGPAGPLPAIAWSAGNVGAVAGLWMLAWRRDPTRRTLHGASGPAQADPARATGPE